MNRTPAPAAELAATIVTAELRRAVARVVDAVDADRAHHDAALAAAVRETEAAGFRVVDGGDSHPSRPWRIWDYRTGETLAEGVGYLEFGAAMDSEAGRGWLHVDGCHEAVMDDVVDRGAVRIVGLPGIPEGFADTIYAWVEDDTDAARSWVEAGGGR